ncbi:hypothetical protein BGX27_006027 [Mortierella sp. AM989]|nr:hypothetical protein BGX27_006027 [Mortierella sp. AM989]
MHNPTIIVTGASRGIGRSITLLAIQKFSANVVGVARSQEDLLQLLNHIENELVIKDRFKFVVGDLTEEGTAKDLVSMALNSWSGRIDGLVLNAGVIEPLGTIASTPVADLKRAFDINFFSIISLVKYALPSLRESKGRIILVSSGAAIKSYHGWGAYCTSKAALNMFGETLGQEETDVTTVSIRPGVVDTEMQAIVRTKGVDNMVPDQYAKFSDMHDAKKLLDPDEPGHVIASLSVKAPSSISGQFFSWDDDQLKEHRNDVLSQAAKSQDSTFKILYFNLHGRSELIRAILAYVGAKWEDLAIDWPKQKEHTPFKCLPVVYEETTDGTVLELAEAQAIERYLGHKFHLFGKNEYEHHKVEQFLTSTDTVQQAFAVKIIGVAPEKRVEVVNKYYAEELSKFIEVHEEHLKKNGSNGHYVGDSTTLADIKTAVFIDRILFLRQKGANEPPFSAEKSPLLWKVRETINNHPSFAEWKKSKRYQELDASTKSAFKFD